MESYEFVCEAHPYTVWPHEDFGLPATCSGPGMPPQTPEQRAILALSNGLKKCRATHPHVDIEEVVEEALTAYRGPEFEDAAAV